MVAPACMAAPLLVMIFGPEYGDYEEPFWPVGIYLVGLLIATFTTLRAGHFLLYRRFGASQEDRGIVLACLLLCATLYTFGGGPGYTWTAIVYTAYFLVPLG